MLNKGISTPIAFTIILILIILVGGYTCWQYKEIQLEIQKEKSRIVEMKIQERKPKEITADIIKEKDIAKWQTFSIDEYGFSIKFPTDYIETSKEEKEYPAPAEMKVKLARFAIENDEVILVVADEAEYIKKDIIPIMILEPLKIIKESENPIEDLKNNVYIETAIEDGDKLISAEEFNKENCKGIQILFEEKTGRYRRELKLYFPNLENLKIEVWFAYHKVIEPEILKMINTIECD